MTTAPILTRRAALAATLALLGACALPPPSPPATIIPGYEFALGANRNDIEAVLGDPIAGPFLDRLSGLSEAVYAFAFNGFTADTRLADGTIRSEVTDRMHLFFDSRGKLVKMTHRPNPYYHSLTDMPVHRVKVAPRLRARDGTVGPANIAR
jgi:hypothetical protein